ncbi:hypothetical protein ES708_18270 [subsurface metagenome]
MRKPIGVFENSAFGFRIHRLAFCKHRSFDKGAVGFLRHGFVPVADIHVDVRFNRRIIGAAVETKASALRTLSLLLPRATEEY